MIRRTTVRTLLAAAIGVIVPAALAVPAQASLGISSFSISPSTTQAGGSLTQPGPNLNIDATFSSHNGDSPKDATISLAPGLLANPSVVPLCPTVDFNAGWCPNSSQIGGGTITGTAPQFAFTLSLPTQAYLIQPQGSEAARIGLIVTFFDFPVASQTAPVSIRTTPNVGIDIPLMGLPNDIDGVPVTIDALHLTISGGVDGSAFTRNPTSCAAATSTLTADSYGDPSTQISQQSTFTPTGCSNLPYAPTVAGTITKDAGDDGVGISATITQQYDESDDQSADLTLPFSASPRLSALTEACANADLTTCPAIGTATVQTPLLAQPLTANIVLVAHTGAIPTLAILIPAPIGLELDATPILTGTAVQALVANIPDVPISSLTLNLPGGPDSLFRGGTHLCSDPQTFGGAFTGWSGATASPTSAATVDGCSGATPNADVNPSPGATTKTTKPKLAHGSSTVGTRSTGLVTYTGLSGARPKLTVALGGGKRVKAIRSVTLRLPAGLRLDRGRLNRSISVTLDGRRVSATATVRNGLLRIVFGRTGRVAIIRIGSPALVVARTLRGHGGRRLTLVATVRGNGGDATLRLSSRSR